MKAIFLWINRGKVVCFLLLVPIVLIACDNSLHVVLKNLTQDNISIGSQGHHIKLGYAAVVAILNEENPTESFEICRSYGCLAKMTITATSFPEEDFYVERAGITLYERQQHSFTTLHMGPISVTLDHYPDPLFPPVDSEGVSEFEITEPDIIFDE